MRDITRRELMEDAGWRVVRVTAEDLFDHPEALIARIRSILASRASWS
jgi:very-short-patch-repair endonuclease